MTISGASPLKLIQKWTQHCKSAILQFLKTVNHYIIHLSPHLPQERVKLFSCTGSEDFSRLVSIFRCSGRMWSMLVTRAPMSPRSSFTLNRTSPSSVTTWPPRGNTSRSSALNLQSKSQTPASLDGSECYADHQHAPNLGVSTIQLVFLYPREAY